MEGCTQNEETDQYLRSQRATEKKGVGTVWREDGCSLNVRSEHAFTGGGIQADTTARRAARHLTAGLVNSNSSVRSQLQNHSLREAVLHGSQGSQQSRLNPGTALTPPPWPSSQLFSTDLHRIHVQLRENKDGLFPVHL